MSDTSTEMGETTVNTSPLRIANYNDAVIEFFKEKKWQFARKTDETLTTSGTKTLDISTITDIRKPGGIYKLFVNDVEVARKYWDYNGDEDEITFVLTPLAGQSVKLIYYAMPERQVAGGSFALLPDEHRKTVAYLAASFALRSRHMNGEAKDRLILYNNSVQNIALKNSEVSKPKTFGYHPLPTRSYR